MLLSTLSSWLLKGVLEKQYLDFEIRMIEWYNDSAWSRLSGSAAFTAAGSVHGAETFNAGSTKS